MVSYRRRGPCTTQSDLNSSMLVLLAVRHDLDDMSKSWRVSAILEICKCRREKSKPWESIVTPTQLFQSQQTAKRSLTRELLVESFLMSYNGWPDLDLFPRAGTEWIVVEHDQSQHWAPNSRWEVCRETVPQSHYDDLWKGYYWTYLFPISLSFSCAKMLRKTNSPRS